MASYPGVRRNAVVAMSSLSDESTSSSNLVSEHVPRPMPENPSAVDRSTKPPPVDRSTKPRRRSEDVTDSPIWPLSSQRESIDEMAINPIPPRNVGAQHVPKAGDGGIFRIENPFLSPGCSSHDLASLVTKMDVNPRYDPEIELKTAGKFKVLREKQYLIAALVAVNFIFIFATWWWPRYYYIYLPFITVTVALNALMVISVIFFSVKHKIWKEKVITPEQPETLMFLLPCYNETPEELTRSMDSLADQTGIDEHPRAMMIICDGKVRGPGMEKTTAEYLLEDLLPDKKSRRYIKGAYSAWTHETMDVEVQAGIYKGLPYFCIIKQQNQGKRDSLICLRSFLHTFNIRSEHPQVMFSPQFFGEMASFVINDAGMQNVTYLVGMDGDTVFADDCVSELIKESHYPNTVGVCGYVAVDFSNHQWGLWNLYQSAEYTISQGLRRFHQSIVTNKVSCLPGCCQLLRVCETTCGDKILMDLFGYCPKPTDNLLKHTRATASEDRNHVCLMLSAFPKAQTRQALRARAITDVPHSWSVFLSQRRRWTLGATSNDLFLVTAPGIYWFERILALANCLVWFVNIFVFASIANLIVAALRVDGWIILCFSAVMLVPVTYYACIVIWIPRTAREKIQYAIGCLIYIICGPFINIVVLVYAVWNVDSFGWGKTRRVIADPTVQEAAIASVDEEKEIGMRRRPHSSPLAIKHETVAVLGADTYALQLLKAFGAPYRAIAYDPSEAALTHLREQFSGTENYCIDTTSDERELAKADVFLITTPAAQSSEGSRTTFLLNDAVEVVSRYVKPGDIVVMESSVSVGTSRYLLGAFELRGAFCGFSPARASDAKGVFTSATKIVSGLSESSLGQVESLYRQVFPRVVSVASAEVAEMCDLLETAHKHSQRMLSSELEDPQNVERLQCNFRKISAMWKEFVVEAETGLEKLSPASEEIGLVISPRTSVSVKAQ